MGFYEEEFSKDNLTGYAWTCLNIASDMAKRDFDTLLLPSRGAVPIVVGTLHALYELGEVGFEKEGKLLRRFRLPAIVQKLARLPIEYHPTKNAINTILVPFTADINVDKEALEQILEKDRLDTSNIDVRNMQAIKKRRREKLQEIEKSIIDGTRKFWARFVSSLYDKNKNQDAYKNYYFNLAKKIENDPSQLEHFDRHPEKMALIDTAISGRASSTILQELDKYTKDVYSFIVVDENGKKFKRNYSDYLKGKQGEHTLKLYPMNRIVTEDRGSSLEGVISIVYPSLLTESKNFDNKNENIRFIPGTWHLGPEGYHTATFDKFIETLRYVIKSELKDKEKEKEELENLFDATRKELIEFLQKYKTMEDEPEELPFNLNPLFKIAKRKESGSRVVHVYFKDIPFQPYNKSK